MNKFQRIIKYAAIAFGLYLALMIIGAIVTGILAISVGIYGVKTLTEVAQVETITEDIVYEEGFNKLDFEISATQLIIKSEGTEYKIETAQIPESTQIENKNGTLQIKQTQKFTTMLENSTIIVYVPENTELENIELEMGAGTVDIENIKAKKIDFSFGAGSVYIKNLAASNAEIECGAGQVIIENTDLTNANLDAGVGKLVYSGFMRNNSEVNCGIGEVELNLGGGNEIYTVRAEKGIGDIKINGNNVANESVTGNGENKISIEGGIGSVKVNM